MGKGYADDDVDADKAITTDRDKVDNNNTKEKYNEGDDYKSSPVSKVNLIDDVKAFSSFYPVVQLIT